MNGKQSLINMFEKAKIGFANPELFGRAINRLYYTRLDSRDYNTGGENFIERDWDNLVILDGCRYDTFEEESTLPGELSAVISRGSMTVEFLEGNITDESMLDTVYITGNGQFYHNSEDLSASFYEVENVWSDSRFWNEENHTVLPETMAERGLEAAEQYPNKRLIVHFIQPHYPFVDSEIEIDDAFDPETPGFWMRLLRGKVDVDEDDVREAYQNNLRLALPHVETLLTELPGKTVVTSDHGNMLGEKASPIPVRDWGHPRGIYTEELVKVPWLEYQNGARKEISAGSSAHEGAEIDDEDVEAHLKELGYLS